VKLRRALAATLLGTALIAGFLAAQALSTPMSTQATCGAAQKTKSAKALSAYKKQMRRQRAAFFRTHTKPKQRARFVKAQNARLAKLKKAASCVARRPTATTRTPPATPTTPPGTPTSTTPPPTTTTSPTPTTPTSPPDATGTVMRPGEVLRPGRSLGSEYGQYRLTMQEDGNLVLYVDRSARPLWHTHTHGHPGAWAVMQTDGNLVVYDSAHRALWSSETAGHAGAYLAVQRDSNLVVYSPASQPLWASGLSNNELRTDEILVAEQYVKALNGRYHLYMQADGNLVLYKEGGPALWWTGTYGHPGAWAIMQADGNFVVYSPNSSPLWHAHTAGHAGANLVVQDDSNLVIYYGGPAIWNIGIRDAPPPPPPAAGGHWLPFRGTYSNAIGCTWNNGCTSPTPGYHGYPAIDFMVSYGTPVYASVSGTVTGYGGCAPNGGPVNCGPNNFGNAIKISSSDGRDAWYGHLSSLVRTSGHVGAGELVAYTGKSGKAFGTHLHYEERPSGGGWGSQVDPGPLKARHGGTTATYPQALGYSGWAATPCGQQFGEPCAARHTIRSDGVG
jgi:murein DD-endopeptidase MepM/ murein hydrolase activator NlpD